MRRIATETSSRHHSTFHRLAVVSRQSAPTPCDILSYDKRLNASEFPRLLSAKRGRVTYTSRSQAGSPPCQSFFTFPIRLFRRCPVTAQPKQWQWISTSLNPPTCTLPKIRDRSQPICETPCASADQKSPTPMMTSMTISSSI